MADGTNPWWVVLASGVISAVGLWLNARGAWLSTRAASQDKRGEREASERTNVLAALDARQTAWINRQDQELEKVRRRVEELEVDRERVWQLARAWSAKAHELRHEVNNSRQVAMALRGDRELAWPVNPLLPGLEEIKT